MKILKYLSILACAFLLVIVGLIIWLNSVDLQEHRATLEEQFTELIGRQIKINGDMDVIVSLQPSFILGDVYLQNAQWGSQENMLKVGEAILKVELIPLIYNKIEVSELSVSELDILIETNAQGKSNWELGEAKTETEQQGGSDIQTEIVLHQAHIKKSNIVIKQHGEKEINLAVDKLNVKHIGGGLEEWDIVAKYNDLLLELSGTTSYLHTLLAGKPFKMDLTGKLGDFNAQVNGDFTLAKNNHIPIINVEFSIYTPDLEDIQQLIGAEVPNLKAIKLSGKAETIDGFSQFNIKGDIDKVSLDANGKISQKFDGQGDNINLIVKAPDLMEVGKLASVELPKVGPVEISSKVTSENGFYQVTLKGDLDKIKVDADGQVSLKFDGQGDDINLKVTATDLAELGALGQIELPKLGPVEISSKITSGNGFYQVTLKGDLQKIKIDADGQVSQKFDGQGDVINLEVTATDLAELGALGQVELPTVGPVNFKAKVNATKNGYKISGLDLKVDKSDVQGDIIIENKQPTYIGAKLTSQLLDLRPFQQNESNENGKEAVKSAEVNSNKVFPSTPLPLEQLKLVNADLNLNINKLQLASDAIKDIQLVLKLDSSKLVLKPFHAKLNGGVIKGDLLLDASKTNSKPRFAVNLNSDKLELGKFKELKDHIQRGETVVKIDLKGSGNSISEIMAGLNGETILDIGEAKLADGSLNLLAGDMIGSLLSMLVPKKEEKKGADLQCGVVRFNIKDGIALADKGIALKSKEIVMVGSGNINLKTEALNFQISSHSLGFSAVDAGDLTRSVGLGGTLANPTPILDILGASKTGATIGAAILTLGTSYVAQKLFDSVTEDNHPCLTALGKTPVE